MHVIIPNQGILNSLFRIIELESDRIRDTITTMDFTRFRLGRRNFTPPILRLKRSFRKKSDFFLPLYETQINRVPMVTLTQRYFVSSSYVYA